MATGHESPCRYGSHRSICKNVCASGTEARKDGENDKQDIISDRGKASLKLY